MLRKFFHYLNSQISTIVKLIFRIFYKNKQPHSQFCPIWTLIRSISINVKGKKIKLFKQLQNQTKLSMGQIPTSNSNRKGVHYHSRKFVGQNYSEHAVGHNGISPIYTQRASCHSQDKERIYKSLVTWGKCSDLTSI